MDFRTKAPQAAGLYDPAHEHDACGVAFVARLHHPAGHEVVRRAIVAIEHLEHRGAEGADPDTGDGAGILLQIPDELYRETVELEEDLPPLGSYGVAMCFLPPDEPHRRQVERIFEDTVASEGQAVLGWRDVPIDPAHCGSAARACAPAIRQLFIGARGDAADDQDAFERRLYVIRRVVERAVGPDLAVPSCSSRTINYKGMLTATQLSHFYPEFQDQRIVSRLALVHSRFSTNTFPSWELAHPYRMVAHNGEINAVMGNRNWMRARESQLACELFGDDIEKVLPVVRPGGSDSATLDNVLELLALAGRNVAHAMMMMIPEAHEGRQDITDEVRDFYAFHACMMEPWDGPAAVAFTDGRNVGATLDRNGLRPGRWVLTDDGFVVLASETGVMPVNECNVVAKGRLHPGKIFLVDLENEKLIVDDHELKQDIATRRPYGQWLRENSVRLEDLPAKQPLAPRTETVRTRQLAFGYSQEDMRALITPMARDGAEPNGSMGNDLALAVMSDRQPPLFNYFKQLFAQVTNPPIDPIRESVVMSLTTGVGAEQNLLEEGPRHAHQLELSQPILRNHELESIRQISGDLFNALTIDITWDVGNGHEAMDAAVSHICDAAHDAIEAGVNIIILSDRNISAQRAAVPSLLAVAAVHNHLVREGTRLRAGVVIESGEPREIHHMATLIGYGASAVNPYLMFESLDEIVEEGKLPEGMTVEEAELAIVGAIGKGLKKVISKMGISTIQSYCGAQIFEAVGLEHALIDRHFTGTASRIGGIGTSVLAREALVRHARAFPRPDSELLPVGGVYQWRRDGERHMWDPETISLLQQAARAENGGGPEAYEKFAARVDEENNKAGLLRGLFQFRTDTVTPVPIDEVEPAAEIVKRFSTGGMSLGALSPEAHETLAIAMNRIGGQSNTGEGGEDRRRFVPDENGDLRRSAIKQVASGRFGVTIEYLVNADEIQIKIAQGAKPGEGGQLPGHKVDSYIASLRHSTPGVGLISPPPHHDIYSIEDLKQLIYDLRCANPEARISVKLVSEVGVGTVAAGVAKANADHVVIAGHDGGTGASPLSSLQSAGVPWEIGLAETQQTLLENDLRSRIVVQTDGQMRTGRDVVIAAILGADEYGFSTAPLIATGCIMMRVCHLNTCPVGVASQDPVLRARFAGKPEHVVNYLIHVAQDTRNIMASLGIRTLDELIGHVELLEMDPAIDHWKASGVDLTSLLRLPDVPEGAARRRVQPPPPVLGDALDWDLVAASHPAIERGERVRLDRKIANVNRCVGGILSSRITQARGPDGLPEGTIDVDFHGSAGQSFGGWLAPGVTFTLRGDANDYAGKGLSGGVIALLPPDGHTYDPSENVVVGNTVLYGATGGRAFFRGLAGERFAVRNSGALAVVEGIGDHGCEYMTGGRVVVLGPTGINFAAGMSGGIAYVLDEHDSFESLCNMELVGFEELGERDEGELRAMILEHAERTSSEIAQRVLDQWPAYREKFVKVMPHDYKRALAELAAVTADS